MTLDINSLESVEVMRFIEIDLPKIIPDFKLRISNGVENGCMVYFGDYVMDVDVAAYHHANAGHPEAIELVRGAAETLMNHAKLHNKGVWN